jgi:hypothetical protein
MIDLCRIVCETTNIKQLLVAKKKWGVQSQKESKKGNRIKPEKSKR